MAIAGTGRPVPILTACCQYRYSSYIVSNTHHHAIDSLIFEIFRLHGDIVAAGDHLTKPGGLTSARWQVLGAIAGSGGATVAELARRIGLARQSVQRVVTELVNERYVDLIDNPQHKRARKAVLTEKGKQSHQVIHSIWTPLAEEMSNRIGPDLLKAATLFLVQVREEFRNLSLTPDSLGIDKWQRREGKVK